MTYVIKRLISSEYRGSFSIRNNFPGQISLFYAATLASGVARNSFQAHVQSCLYLYELYSWLRASAGYPMPKVPTSIRQWSFAFYGPIVWNSLLCVTLACRRTDSNGSWKLLILKVGLMNSTLGVSAIQKPYNHVSSVASLAVFESDGNASKRRSCSFFMYNGNVDSV